MSEANQSESRSALPNVGDTLGERYLLRRVIGEGGFAVVFEAADTRVGGRVAVKVLHPEKSQDAEFAARFDQEVKVVRHLQHPNTVKIHDMGTTGSGCMYMVMEILDGKPLDDFLKEHGALDPARVLHIVRQILSSLSEAHQKGIVHRDLKPANVMLCDLGGETDFVKVLDFGIAKALEADLGQVHTKTGLVFCTPKYAPPEILLSQGVTPAADVYAVAVMALDLLMGGSPLASLSDAEAIAFQLSDQELPIPPEIEALTFGPVLRKATAKSIDVRYRSAQQMLIALDMTVVQSDLPTVPLVVTSTVDVTAPMSAASHVFATREEATLQAQARQAAASPTRRMEVDEGSSKAAWIVILLALLVFGGIGAFVLINQGKESTLGTADTGSSEAADTGEVAAVDQPDLTPEPVVEEPLVEERVSAQQILQARLAASDWETGGWLASLPEDEVVRVGPRPQTASVEPVVTATEGTGVGGTRVDIFDVTVEREASAEAARLALLYESVQANESALSLLQLAIESNTLTGEDRVAAIREMVSLTRNSVQVMLELGRCEAAERRIMSAQTDLARLGSAPSATLELTALTFRIDACRTAREEEMLEWNARAYLAHVRRGDEHFREAQQSDDPDARRELLYRSLYERENAIEQLRIALASGDLTPEQTADARRDVLRLNEEVLATMLDLELTVAAEAQLEAVLEDPNVLPEDAATALALLATQLDEEAQTETEEELAVIVGPAEGTGLGLAAGTGVGTGGGTGMGAVAGWDWGHYQTLVDQGAQLYEEALVMHEPVVEEVVPVEELPVQGPEMPPMYSATVTITSEPRRIRIYVGDEQIGRTPFEGVIERRFPEVTLVFRKTDYQTLRISLELDGGTFQRHIELQSDHPFGRTETIGNRP